MTAADTSPAKKARRGDLAVVVTVDRDAFTNPSQGLRVRRSVRIGVVSNITRQGVAKLVRVPFSADDTEPTPREVRLGDKVMLVSRDRVDVEAVLAAYRQRRWNGTNMVRPFDTVDEAKALVQQHVRDVA